MSEYEEEMLLKELQKCGLHLRKLKEKLYRYCEKRVFVKGSTILKMYAKIPSLTLNCQKKLAIHWYHLDCELFVFASICAIFLFLYRLTVLFF